VIGQLTEDWGEVLFSALKRAGGTAFSNMAVGYNNVDVAAANRNGIAVGNTPVTWMDRSITSFCFCFNFSFNQLTNRQYSGCSDGDDG
jgi:hypothetical protein